VLAIALGLSSSLCWGLADFFGGLQTRRHHVLGVLLVSQMAAAAVLAVGALAFIDLPGRDAALWAGLGSLAGTAGLGAFYRGLAIGTMSIVAPVSACGAAVPVIVGVAQGERPGAVQTLGIAIALVGVVLAARETGDSTASHRASIFLGLLAALGFGTFFVALAEATDRSSPLGAIAVARATALPVLALLAFAVRPSLPGPSAWPALAAIGLLDVTANALFALASQKGLLSVVAVVGSLYPAITVLLARFVLHERIGRLQQGGVVVALAGVILISAG
jgi:drug/metabolite transporter (DMT)-like permease